MSAGGKGSSPRPYSVTQETFASNWDAVFGVSMLERKRREEALQLMVEESERLGLYTDLYDPVQKKQDSV